VAGDVIENDEPRTVEVIEMPESYLLTKFDGATATEIETGLEHGDVVFFERCPVGLPSDADLAFLREGLPDQSKLKNISYHPESDSVPKFEAPADVQVRVKNILKTHRSSIERYLRENLPSLAPGWTVGTTSFRAVEEGGRDLKPRSNSEIVHVDAGAYGATNGDRILRFFVNVNPSADRVWGTKGSFRSLIRKYSALLDAARGKRGYVSLQKGLADNCFSALVNVLSKLYPLAKVIDSSPYDRAMRRIHNYMKESLEFREDLSEYREISFPPFSAWSVMTDGISHSVVSGRYALITTVIIPLENCRHHDYTPFHLLAAAD